MKKRETITLNVPPLVAKAFREAVDDYGGKIGVCTAAAMALFIRATPDQRTQVFQELYTAELEGNLEQYLDKLRKSGTIKSK